MKALSTNRFHRVTARRRSPMFPAAFGDRWCGVPHCSPVFPLVPQCSGLSRFLEIWKTKPSAKTAVPEMSQIVPLPTNTILRRVGEALWRKELAEKPPLRGWDSGTFTTGAIEKLAKGPGIAMLRDVVTGFDQLRS